MTEPTVEAWRDLLADVGATAESAEVVAAGERLLARWSEPQRAYHTSEHLADVLARIRELGAGEEPRTVAVTVLAAWWHDAVYEPRATDNEDRSADLAAAELAALGVDRATVAEVAHLVRLTATHDADPADRAGALLCDADLAILAADPERYDAYAADVRREYAHVGEADFRAGRAAVLAGLRSRDPLYATDVARRRWTAAARRNLDRELAALSAPDGGGADPPRSAG